MKESNICAPGDVDQDRFLDPPADNADEDLIFGGELGLAEPADSALEDVFAEDSDVELLSNNLEADGGEADERLGDLDFVPDMAGGGPSAPQTAVVDSSKKLAQVTAGRVVGEDSSARSLVDTGADNGFAGRQEAVTDDGDGELILKMCCFAARFMHYGIEDIAQLFSTTTWRTKKNGAGIIGGAMQYHQRDPRWH
ncbi:hypothetical protein JKF63_01994 [Porcisia hertigi]|uniref:Uncharacterized protein n=1 Tax=Porcisia hertigi TaxID=2761500 RepID=A0A836HJZ8_9TRYP|nr:hypothetical protein JKF63_01994 [Porcisia hertigi]